MEDNGNRTRDEVFSISVRAGKRTYFFDVKSTKTEKLYLTITESKKRFNNEDGKFFFEKHKLFLYQEDFDKFTQGLTDVIEFIKTGVKPEITHYGSNNEEPASGISSDEYDVEI
jgi:hypothetical protein